MVSPGYLREQVSKGKYVWVCKLPSEHDPDVDCDLQFTAKTNRKHLFEEHRLNVHGVEGELPGLPRGPPSTFSSIDDKKAAKNLAQKKYADTHKEEIVARREQKKFDEAVQNYIWEFEKQLTRQQAPDPLPFKPPGLMAFIADVLSERCPGQSVHLSTWSKEMDLLWSLAERNVIFIALMAEVTETMEPAKVKLEVVRAYAGLARITCSDEDQREWYAANVWNPLQQRALKMLNNKYLGKNMLSSVKDEEVTEDKVHQASFVRFVEVEKRRAFQSIDPRHLHDTLVERAFKQVASEGALPDVSQEDQLLREIAALSF